ncbi:MAG: MATE family efflux transporter, partial [Lachnoclostridium sp.]|nr:MATE family efflux transporter [Lachnoclostridium sp.]
SIVAISIFNGVSQGAQPLFSQFYGRGDDRAVRKILKMALGTAIVLALTVVISAGMLAEPLVRIFNSENNVQMAAYGVEGVRIYFVGFLFAGFNIVGAGYLGATENSGWAFLTSIMRGIVAISVCAFVLARIFGMTGIWMAFPAAELLTTFCTSTAIKKG